MSRRRYTRLFYAFAALALLFAGTVKVLRSGPLLACQSKREQLLTEIDARRRCQQNEECTLLVRTCGAFATCGEAVRADQLPTLDTLTKSFETECEALGGMRCVSCARQKAVCIEQRCTAVQDL